MIGCIPPLLANAIIGGPQARDAALRAEYLDGEPGEECPQSGAFTDDESAVLSYLVAMKDCGRWIPASELIAQTLIPDRRMRQTICDLVKRGEPIVSMAGPGGGFKYTETAAELVEDRARKRAEALAILYRLSRQDRTLVLKELAGQERLEEFGGRNSGGMTIAERPKFIHTDNGDDFHMPQKKTAAERDEERNHG